VICSFVPRSWAGTRSVLLPYHHSNLDCDSVLYYVEGNYASRRASSRAPHPPRERIGPRAAAGALEASEDRPAETDELAVMIETFRPLHRTQVARQVVDTAYPSPGMTGARGRQAVSPETEAGPVGVRWKVMRRERGAREGAVTAWVRGEIEAGGWVRAGAATAQRLRERYGADAVADLSLGQPLEASRRFDRPSSGGLGGPPPPLRLHAHLGYPELRERLAEDVDVAGVTAQSVAVTVGAAGAISMALRLRGGGSEVVVLAPTSPSSASTARSAATGCGGGSAEDGSLDLEAIAAALNDATAP